MKLRAQASLEFVFMVATGILFVLIVIRRFIDPRTSTLHKVGAQINDTVNRTATVLESMISTP